MSYAVEFTWSPNDKIVTPLGEKGIITLVAVDESFIVMYFVKSINGSTWWTEKQLLECNGS